MQQLPNITSPANARPRLVTQRAESIAIGYFFQSYLPFQRPGVIARASSQVSVALLPSGAVRFPVTHSCDRRAG